MKKKTARILSLLLAVLLTVSLLPQCVLADDFFEYYDYNGDCQTGFLCHNCDEEYTDGEEYYYCSEDDYVYCESCICSSCNRCEEHCICAAREELPVAYTASELELPDPPALPDFPDYSEALDGLEDILSKARDGLDSKYYAFTKNDDGSRTVDIWNFFLEICGESTEAACIDKLWKGADIKAKLQKYDSTLVGSKSASATTKFVQKLAADSGIETLLDKSFQWTQKTKLTDKYAALEKLLTALKQDAKAAGFTEEELNKIKIDKTSNAAFSQMEFGVQMQGNFDDDYRDYTYVLRVPERTLNNDNPGSYQASLFVHEFTHFLAALRGNAVRDLSVNELTISKKTEAADIRFYMTQTKYSSPDETNRRAADDASFMQFLNSRVMYYSQLEERNANQAMNVIYTQWELSGDPAMEIFKNWGYEIMPSAIAYHNSKTYDEKGLTYLNKMADLIPELGLISSDIPFELLDEIDDGDRDELDYNGGDRRNGYGTELFFRYFGADGTSYILPTRAMYDWVVEKTGKKPFDWEAMISATVGKSKTKSLRSALKTLNVETIMLESPAPEDFPADLYEYFDAISLMMELNDATNEDENRRAEVIGRIQAMLNEADTLESNLENMDDIESKADDLEERSTTAEQYADELEDMAEEYETLLFDAELLWDEADGCLEDYADELNDAYTSALDTDDELGQSPEDIAADLQSAYEDRISELQDEINEMDALLEQKAGEIEEKMGELQGVLTEIEQISDELEGLCNDQESYAEQLEAIWDEIDDLSDLLSELKAKSDSEEAQPQEMERIVSATVTDTDGNPLAGIGIYYSLPHSKEHRLLGKTNEYGYAEAAIDESSKNHGWKLSAGLGTAVKDDEGDWYLVPEEETYYFCVEEEDEQYCYSIYQRFELEESKQSGDEQGNGGLRVVLRGKNTDAAELPNPEFYINGEGTRTIPCSWKEYYDGMMSRDNVVCNQKVVIDYWKQYMTESMAGRYGAWLLPLSEDGQLPRQNTQWIFAPLYKWENGKAVSQLVPADDFAAEDPDDPDFVNYTSYAIDFGSVPAGRYELAVVMPDESTHFEEVTILSGETVSVDAQSWLAVDYESSRLRRLKFWYTIYNLDESKLGEVQEAIEPTFALCVNETGKRVWSYVSFVEGGMPTALFPVSCPKITDEFNSVGMQAFSGQMYLLSSCNDYHLFPVTYQYHCYNTKNGWKYRGAYISEIYGIGAEDEKLYKPAYVEFVERYYTADLKAHYKTIKGTVNFDLHWETPEGDYPEEWSSLCEVRPDFAVSQNHVGVLQNYVYRRDNTAGEGVTYRFRYGRTGLDYAASVAPSVLTEISPNFKTTTTELLSFRDEVWTKTGVPDGLSGTAWLKTKEVAGANGKEVTLIAQSEAVSSYKGTVYRFAFTPSCRAYGHDWQQSGKTVYCSRCGTTDTEEMPRVIEYVVPDGVTVEEPPLGWYVEGLPHPDGTPNGIDCVFAGWSETPIDCTDTKPTLWEDADEYFATEKQKDGQYEPVKLYAVFRRTETVRVTGNSGNWSGQYTFVVENVHAYENFGNMQTANLLSESHLAEVSQRDYCLTLSGQGAGLRASDNLANSALTVTGDSREGYKIRTEGVTAAPMYLCCKDGKLSADITGSLFDISYHASEQRVIIQSREDGSYLALDGLRVYARNDWANSFTPFWTGTVYFRTGEQLPVDKELVFGQVPFQNQFAEETMKPVGAVAALVERQGGEVISVTDVTDCVTYRVFLNGDDMAYYQAVYRDKSDGSCVRAFVPVSVAEKNHIPNTTYQLQLGGSWKSRFRLGRDAYTHEGQEVYLLYYDGNNVYEAECLTAEDAAVSAIPKWNFDLDIQNPASIPAGTYQVTVSAAIFSARGRQGVPLASTNYTIHLTNSLARPFPGAIERYEPEVTQDWLNEHIVDPNIRDTIDSILGKYGWHGRVDLWLEKLGIHSLEGIEDIPELKEVWVRDNEITQVDPDSVKNLGVLVLGKQESTIRVEKQGDVVSAELSRVVSKENLQYVRDVTVLDSRGTKLEATYQRSNGKLLVPVRERKSLPEEEITIRYEYEVPYGDGKTALMTVYLTPSEIVDLAPSENTYSFRPILQTIVNGTEKTDTFRFVLTRDGEEAYTTVAGSGYGQFAPITYTKAGSYEYQLYQISDETLDYTFDSRVYTATVEVGSDGKILRVTWSCGGNAVDCPVFVNRMDSAADTAEIEVSEEPLGYVPDEPEQYIWKLTPITRGAPMPPYTQISAFGSGSEVFEISFDSAGTWEYQITQLPGTNKNCTYDDAVYSVTVSAMETENGIEANILKISRSPSLSMREYEIVFQNQYEDARIHTHTWENGVCTGCGMVQKQVECPSKLFTDAPKKGNWAHEGIDYCVANGLMNGMSATTFVPGGTVTRGQLVTILYRMAGSPEVPFKGTFTDVKNGKFYSNAVEWAAANGIVNGITATTFAPDSPITREQIAAILYRYSKSPAVTGNLSAYPDGSTAGSYAKNALIWATQQGLINGVASNGQTLLQPKAKATRAQIAAIIMRFQSGSYRCG